MKPDPQFASIGLETTSKRVIDNWQQWDITLRTKPELVRPLQGGRSNHSFLLRSDDTRMVLRVNSPQAPLTGIDRQSEARIWRAASQQGIAPPLLYVDQRTGSLVSTYIENSLPPDEQANEAVIDQVFDLLDRCHRLDVDAPVLDYNKHLDHYWKLIGDRRNTTESSLLEQRKPMQLLLKALLSSDAQTGLCHHDPVIANFVGDPTSLYLIDWEYAAYGLVVMDYAAVAIEWDLDDKLVVERSGVFPDHFIMAKKLYHYTCDLWQAL